jgi:hypothetical protein
MQFSLSLEDKFILDDLREDWGCTKSEAVARLLKEAESRYGRRSGRFRIRGGRGRRNKKNHDSVSTGGKVG